MFVGGTCNCTHALNEFTIDSQGFSTSVHIHSKIVVVFWVICVYMKTDRIFSPAWHSKL